MPLVDSDDLATVSDLAVRYGVGASAVANWIARYPDFPAPVYPGRPRAGSLYLASAVDQWWTAKFGKDPA